MTNNKQQTAVDWLVEQFTFKTIGGVYTTDGTDDVTNLVEHAKEMEVAGKEMSYADGYKEGYKRALDYITMAIKKSKSYNKK
jgi:uncharacterized glyoxalase superfamily protein PhnB